MIDIIIFIKIIRNFYKIWVCSSITYDFIYKSFFAKADVIYLTGIFGAGEKTLSWEEQKHIKKKRKSRLDGVPLKLPALVRSQRLQQKASEVGFDWDNINSVWDKVYEELDELKNAYRECNEKKIQEEIGDILFSIVNLSRHLNISAEDMLRKGNKKFIKRFKTIEKTVNKKGLNIEELSLKEMDQIWDQLKLRE